MCHLGEIGAVFNLLRDLKIIENILPLIAQDQDVRLIEVALNALYEFLSLGERVAQPNPLLRMLENTVGFCERLETLQKHKSPDLYRLVVKLMQRFFTLEENNIF